MHLELKNVEGKEVGEGIDVGSH